jgi:hypothetical protein
MPIVVRADYLRLFCVELLFEQIVDDPQYQQKALF